MAGRAEEHEHSMGAGAVALVWLAVIVGGVGTGVETFSWSVQPLIFLPSLALFIAGVVVLWIRDEPWGWLWRD